MALGWIAFALLSILLGSAREITQKRALKGEHTLEYLVVRSLFTIPIYVAIIFLLDLNLNLPWQGYALTLLVAVFAAVGITKKNKAMKHIDISIVQPLMNLQPIVVTILAFLLMGETITLLQGAGVLLIVFGTYALEIDHKHHGLLGPLKKMTESKYTLLVMGAVVIFGFTKTLDRLILTNHFNPITYLVVIGLMLNVIFIGYHYYQYNLKNIKNVVREQGTKIIWPSIFRISAAFAFYQSMALAASAGLVTAIVRTQSLITTVEGGIFFHEDNLTKKGLTCLVMVAGAILVVV